MEISVVSFGQTRNITYEMDSEGYVVCMRPGTIQAHIDVSFNGSDPVRLPVKESQFEDFLSTVKD